jgi:hypothetical protein
MKKSLVLGLAALVLLAWDATAQSRSSRSRRGTSSVLVGPLGSAERTRLLEKSRVATKIAPDEARLGSAERRALLTGSRTSLYPRRGTRR